MPLEFESEDQLNQLLSQAQPDLNAPVEPIQSEALEPLEFESEAELESAMMPAQDPATPTLEVAASLGVDPGGLAEAVLGKTIPEPKETRVDRRTLLDGYEQSVNSIPKRMPEGLEEFHPADMGRVTQVLAASFMSMSSTGVVLDPTERVMYATSVMENSGVRADVRAQLVDQAMRDGKILPQALPKSWYEARGLLLLPPDLDLGDIQLED